MLRQARFAAGEGPVLHVGDLQDGRGADQFLDARRIVHARQLHQDLVLDRPPGRTAAPMAPSAPSWLMRLLMVWMVRSTVSRFSATRSEGFSRIE